MRIQLEGRPFSKIQFNDLMRKRGLKTPSIINHGYRPSKYHKEFFSLSLLM
jgi:hypothetical protein